ncbi:hypothetical protein Tco_1442250 [Tanacetum coccineum]
MSLKITQSPSGSLDRSEGSENSGIFEDSGRPDEEYSEDEASSKEGGSKTPHVQRSPRESRAPVRYSPSANYLLLTENGKPESYSESLSSKESVYWKKAINEEMVSLEKNQTCSLVRISAGKKASQRLWMFKVKEDQDGSKGYKARLVVTGFQQKQGVKPRVQIEGNYVRTDSSTEAVGDEREVEVLRSFNWPSSELITDDDVLPERVQKGRAVALFKGRKVRAVALLKGRWFEVYKDYLRWIAVK